MTDRLTDALEAERDRLARILAVERGDESAGRPPRMRRVEP